MANSKRPATALLVYKLGRVEMLEHRLAVTTHITTRFELRYVGRATLLALDGFDWHGFYASSENVSLTESIIAMVQRQDEQLVTRMHAHRGWSSRWKHSPFSCSPD